MTRRRFIGATELGSGTRFAASGGANHLNKAAPVSSRSTIAERACARLVRAAGATRRPIGLQARGSAPLRLRSAAIAARGPAPQWLSGRPMTSPNA